MAITKKDVAPAPADDKPQDLAPATEPEASGAIAEPAILKGVDMSHPSVDANPRANSTAEMNSIDFNNPSGLVSQEDSVIENLREAGAKPKGHKPRTKHK